MGHLVLLGGGHAHLSLLDAAPRLVAAGHRVTLVTPEPEHYYSGMGPGMLGGWYTPSEICFPLERMAADARVAFVRDRAVRIRPDDRQVDLAGGATIAYDVLSLNTGSSIAPTVAVDDDLPGSGPRVFTVKPLQEMVQARRFVESRAARSPVSVVVVGGGPAAVETAAAFRRLIDSAAPEAARRSEVTLIAGRTILPVDCCM